MLKEGEPPSSDSVWRLYLGWIENITAEEEDGLDNGIIPPGTPLIFLQIHGKTTRMEIILAQTMQKFPPIDEVLNRTEAEIAELKIEHRKLALDKIDDPVIKGLLTLKYELKDIDPID